MHSSHVAQPTSFTRISDCAVAQSEQRSFVCAALEIQSEWQQGLYMFSNSGKVPNQSRPFWYMNDLAYLY